MYIPRHAHLQDMAPCKFTPEEINVIRTHLNVLCTDLQSLRINDETKGTNASNIKTSKYIDNKEWIGQLMNRECDLLSFIYKRICKVKKMLNEKKLKTVEKLYISHDVSLDTIRAMTESNKAKLYDRVIKTNELLRWIRLNSINRIELENVCEDYYSDEELRGPEMTHYIRWEFVRYIYELIEFLPFDYEYITPNKVEDVSDDEDDEMIRELIQRMN